MPWVYSGSGHVRVLSQYVLFEILPSYHDLQELPDFSCLVDFSSNANDIRVVGGIYFLQFCRFMQENPEVLKMKRRQVKVFAELRPEMAHLPEYLLGDSPALTDSGDVFPRATIDSVKCAMKEIFEDLGEDRFEHVHNRAKESQIPSARESATAVLLDFQRKITSWAAVNPSLDLDHIQKAPLRFSRKLVLVASLLDKAPNLGGLARTAEIFSAESLVVGDLSIRDNDVFKTVSVTAGNWVPMQQVVPEDVSYSSFPLLVIE